MILFNISLKKNYCSTKPPRPFNNRNINWLIFLGRRIGNECFFMVFLGDRWWQILPFCLKIFFFLEIAMCLSRNFYPLTHKMSAKTFSNATSPSECSLAIGVLTKYHVLKVIHLIFENRHTIVLEQSSVLINKLSYNSSSCIKNCFCWCYLHFIKNVDKYLAPLVFSR